MVNTQVKEANAKTREYRSAGAQGFPGCLLMLNCPGKECIHSTEAGLLTLKEFLRMQIIAAKQVPKLPEILQKEMRM